MLQTALLMYSKDVQLDAMKALDYTIEDLAETLSFTRLHAAAAMLPGHEPLTAMMLEQDFQDVNTPDRMGKAPLHWACLRGDASAVQLLLE